MKKSLSSLLVLITVFSLFTQIVYPIMMTKAYAQEVGEILSSLSSNVSETITSTLDSISSNTTNSETSTSNESQSSVESSTESSNVTSSETSTNTSVEETQSTSVGSSQETSSLTSSSVSSTSSSQEVVVTTNEIVQAAYVEQRVQEIKCVNGKTATSSYLDVVLGNKKNGSPVDLNRADPFQATNFPDGTVGGSAVVGKFLSLGFGGKTTLEFFVPVYRQMGNELEFYEVTNGRTSYPEEKAKVEVSSNNSDWYPLNPLSSKENAGGKMVRSIPNDLIFVKFVRITDTSNSALFENTADGFDLDAVVGVCSSKVELCKENRGGKPLSDWELYLQSKNPIVEINVNSNDSNGELTPVLDSTKDYLFKVSGTWTNRNGSEPRDAFFSSGGVNEGMYYPNDRTSDEDSNAIYDQRIIKFVLNNTPTDLDGFKAMWGEDYEQTTHEYSTVFSGTGSAVEMKVWDFPIGSNNPSWYSDNGGTLNVKIYEILKGVTNKSGCITLTGVQFGEYILGEEMKNNWEFVSWTADQDGTVIVNDIEHRFSIKNKKTVTDVRVCKEDTQGNRLSGWDVYLGKIVETISMPVDGSSVNSTNLSADNYVLVGSGTYRYGSEEMIADSGYSFRPNGIPSGIGNWFSGDNFPNPYKGYLETQVNSSNVDWEPYSPTHTYVLPMMSYAGGQMSFRILDDSYSDNLNNGDFKVSIYRVLSGKTNKNGCFKFKDIELGNYTLIEGMQNGWRFDNFKKDNRWMPSLSDVEVDNNVVNGTNPQNVRISHRSKRFTFVNARLNPDYSYYKEANVDSNQVQSGDQIDYVINYLNKGQMDVNNVTLSDTVPANTSNTLGAVAVLCDGTEVAIPSSPTLSYTFASVEVGCKVSLKFSVNVNEELEACTQIDNIGTVQLGENQESLNTNTVSYVANCNQSSQSSSFSSQTSSTQSSEFSSETSTQSSATSSGPSSSSTTATLSSNTSSTGQVLGSQDTASSSSSQTITTRSVLGVTGESIGIMVLLGILLTTFSGFIFVVSIKRLKVTR